MASQQSQQTQQPPQASSDTSSNYLATIRPTAFNANRADGVPLQPQPSTPVAALKATMVKLDAAWQERFHISERTNHDRFTAKGTEHQCEVAALKAENQSLKARLNHEEWTGVEQVLNEELRSVRDENTKLRAQERNFISSKKRADLKIRNDAAKIDALEKELKELKEHHASLKKDLQQLLARHL